MNYRLNIVKIRAQAYVAFPVHLNDQTFEMLKVFLTKEIEKDALPKGYVFEFFFHPHGVGLWTPPDESVYPAMKLVERAYNKTMQAKEELNICEAASPTRH